MTALPVITVRQPWAWAMFHAGKGTENRLKNIVGHYRGPLLIHTSRKVDDTDGIGHCMWLCELAGNDDATRWANDPAGQLGAIIGVVDLVDVHYFAAGFVPVCGRCGGSAWAARGQHHLCIRNQRPFTEPIPAVGKLGMWWWTPPAGWTLEHALQEAS